MSSVDRHGAIDGIRSSQQPRSTDGRSQHEAIVSHDARVVRIVTGWEHRPANLYSVLYTASVARIVPFTEARARLTELLDDIEARHEHVVITRKGRPAAVVVSSAEWEAIEETLDVLQDEQALADLRESEEDVKAARLYGLDDVRRELGLA